MDKLDKNNDLNSISVSTPDDVSFNSDFIQYEEIQAIVDINEHQESESGNIISSIEQCRRKSDSKPKFFSTKNEWYQKYSLEEKFIRAEDGKTHTSGLQSAGEQKLRLWENYLEGDTIS